jgi:PST family polysaccharide transporter
MKGSNFFKRFLQIDLVKVFSLTATSTLVKMLTAFVSIKIVASILGPSGIALIGQLNNFVSIIMALASVGINQGVTKYISQNKDSKEEVRKFIGTAFKMTLFSSLFCGINLIIFNKFLSNKILNSEEYGYVFIVFGFVIIFYALNNLLLSILNGFQQYKKFVTINIINSLIGLVFTITLVYFWQLKGALISLISYQSTMFFITFWMLKKRYWVAFISFREKLVKQVAQKYFHYTLMAITTAATVPVSQLFIRSYVISNISIVDAGYWEGMNKISSMYLMVITSSLGVYFLPKLAELNTNLELRKEIFKVYKIIMPVLAIGLLSIYFLRYFIVSILFTEDFAPMSSLFAYQLIGDFFKIAAWLLAFNMIAKSMTKTFIATEIIGSLTFVVLALFFVNINGVIGITQAYMINYIAYLLIMLLIFRKLVFNIK